MYTQKEKLVGLYVLTAYDALQRGNDAAFGFEQEANFYYLTGIEHPGWTLVIDAGAKKEWLIAPELSVTHELFDGSLSREEASRISGVQHVLNFEDGKTLLCELARKHSLVKTIDQPEYASHFNFQLNPALKRNRQVLERIFNSVEICNQEFAQIRAIKSDDEIKKIQSAIDLTIEGFEAVKDALTASKYEYELEALFSYVFRKNGAKGHAYDPIVASGINACILHYIHNQSKLSNKELVLMDVGARKNGYAADITRTYAKGTPTKRQSAVHEAVQVAHQKIITYLGPDVSVEEYSAFVDQTMKDALISLNLLKDTNDDETYRRYFPHAISHGLGLDVHDSLGRPKYFKPGMVLTVEPGIYIPEEKMGIRIEDDILITVSGHKNMSAKLSTGL